MSGGFVVTEASCASFFRDKFPTFFGEMRYLLVTGTGPREIAEAGRIWGASELTAGMMESAACFEHRSLCSRP